MATQSEKARRTGIWVATLQPGGGVVFITCATLACLRWRTLNRRIRSCATYVHRDPI